jgi:hypothetical protein
MKLLIKAACSSLAFRNGLVALFLLLLASPVYADTPIDLAELEKAGFTKQRWQQLKDSERTALYRAYVPDKEMLERARVGLIEPQSVEECISGEAPTIAEARKRFPRYYPLQGRMRDVAGTLEYINRKLFFRTATQLYHVDEYHILHRLEKLGHKRNSKPRKAIVDAVWAINSIGGLRFLYAQKIKLAKE